MPAPSAQQLLFKPDTWFSKRYTVLRAHGAPVGPLDLGAWRTWGQLTLPTPGATIGRDARDGALVLYRDGAPAAQAVKEGVFAPRYLVAWPDGEGVLRPRRGDPQVYTLDVEGTGEVARLARTTWTKRHVAASFPEDWPLDRALFVGAVVLLAWVIQDASVVVTVGG